MVKTEYQSRTFPDKIKNILYLRQKGLCKICKTSLEHGCHADHITPFSKGGKTSIWNCQLLCPRCNMKKGDKEMSEFKPRKWQEQCIEKGYVKYKEIDKYDKKSYFVKAVPGAGKTYLSCKIIERIYFEEQGKIKIFIVTPNDGVRTQWVDRAYEFTDGVINLSYETSKYYVVTWTSFQGIVVTYQSISNDANYNTIKESILQLKEKDYKIITIFDEIHHTSGENVWGNYAINLFNDLSDFIICLSGTPYRKDNDEIAFLNYTNTGDRRAIPDFEYSRSDAIRHQVVRPTIHKLVDATFNLVNTDSGEMITTEILDANKTEARSKIVMDSLDPSKPIANKVLDEVVRYLEEVVMVDDPEAGAFITVSENKYIKPIKEILQTKTNLGILTTFDNDEKMDEILEFKNNPFRYSYIISCKKISEGVDIPRLRVMGYLTNITTLLYFEQAVGRITRFNKDLGGDQYAYVIAPKFPWNVENCKNIEKEIQPAIQDREKLVKEYKERKQNNEEVFIEDGELFVSQSIELNGMDSIHQKVHINQLESDRIINRLGDIFPNTDPVIILSKLNELNSDEQNILLRQWGYEINIPKPVYKNPIEKINDLQNKINKSITSFGLRTGKLDRVVGNYGEFRGSINKEFNLQSKYYKENKNGITSMLGQVDENYLPEYVDWLRIKYNIQVEV